MSVNSLPMIRGDDRIAHIEKWAVLLGGSSVPDERPVSLEVTTSMS